MSDIDPMQAFYRRAVSEPTRGKTPRFGVQDAPDLIFRLPVITLVGLIAWVALRWFTRTYLQNPCSVPEGWNCYAGVSDIGRFLHLVGTVLVVVVAWRISLRLEKGEPADLPPASTAAKRAAFVSGFIFLLLGVAIPVGLIMALPNCNSDCGGIGFVALFTVGFLWGSGLLLIGAGALAHERGRAPRLSAPVTWLWGLFGALCLFATGGSVLDFPNAKTALFWSVMIGLPGLSGIVVAVVSSRLRPRSSA